MVVAGDRVWVGYTPDSDRNEVRMRRFLVANGFVDEPYWYQLVDDVSPRLVTDVTVGANTDDFDNRVYPVVITTGNDVHFYWTDLTGTTFSEVSPAASDASDGIDFTWCRRSAGSYVAYVSYLSTSDDVVVWGVDLLGDWTRVMSAPFTGTYPRTAISAARDAVYVAYDHEFTYGDGTRYRASYDSGGSWSNGDLYRPNPGDPAGFAPDLSLRSGVGSAAVYNREDGVVDGAYTMTRRGYGPGAWTAAQQYNTNDLVSGSRSHIEWLGSSCVMSYGMVYLAEGYIPYFDLLTPRAFLCDGFESGDLSGW
jgi:hypothetical protein